MCRSILDLIIRDVTLDVDGTPLALNGRIVEHPTPSREFAARAGRGVGRPIRCVFLGYLWKVARELHNSQSVNLLGVGLEPQRIRTQEAKEFLAKSNIAWFEAAQIRTNQDFQSYMGQGIDLLVVGAFGQILPLEIISQCHLGALNVHTSLLPSYRGGTPIESQILAGDTQGGVTVHWVTKGVDSGPIAARKAIDLKPDSDSYEMIYERYHDAASDLLRSLLDLSVNDWPRKPQHGHFPLIRPVKSADFVIDWNEDALMIRRKVLACGWKEWVRCPLKEGDLIIRGADVYTQANNAEPGQVLEAGSRTVIATGGHALVLKQWTTPRNLVLGEILPSHRDGK